MRSPAEIEATLAGLDRMDRLDLLRAWQEEIITAVTSPVRQKAQRLVEIFDRHQGGDISLGVAVNDAIDAFSFLRDLARTDP